MLEHRADLTKKTSDLKNTWRPHQSTLTIGIMALSIGSSFNGALGTFVAHAHGQGETRMCRVYMNRAIFLASIVYIMILIPLLFIKQIYAAIGQDEEMAEYAT